MFRSMILILAVAILSAGCATVPMESKDISSQAKQFNPPSAGMASLYIYRGGGLGTALKKDIWLDGRCVGESAPNVFFHEEVAGDQEHTVATESEFSPNSLKLTTARARIYFIRQYMKMGVFVGGANLEVVDDAQGRKDVSELELARRGTCSH